MPGLSVGRCGIDYVATPAPAKLLTPPTLPRVYVNGAPIAVVETAVTPHGKGIHTVSVMKQGSVRVFAGGVPVCANGHLASCGHPLVSTSNVFVGG